jgi:hypothetical protein
MLIPVKSNIGSAPKLSNGRQLLSGNREIYIFDGQKHRDRGPAEIHPDGYKAWFKKGLRHNYSGPAIINPKERYQEFWINGKFIRRENL